MPSTASGSVEVVKDGLTPPAGAESADPMDYVESRTTQTPNLPSRLQKVVAAPHTILPAMLPSPPSLTPLYLPQPPSPDVEPMDVIPPTPLPSMSHSVLPANPASITIPPMSPARAARFSNTLVFTNGHVTPSRKRSLEVYTPPPRFPFALGSSYSGSTASSLPPAEFPNLESFRPNANHHPKRIRISDGASAQQYQDPFGGETSRGPAASVAWM
ncbi:hypothetical protein M427DRAFT_59558 [Gonapodya prolifera JEL478]|uniref:Uncharacterized protein n=1 Tax=Gonapodya prolifera (strain JEL478) TaxID=1344416 RepID=A0A139A6G8_GONPJ|nr:hypothetical protein M427DRAFT_59558 [Gonapodya prolifera JEL478]|eukprot:KXS12410.1 hypothetical protein M427DRAFT_59558 [Gonapodya prolifera JEL478]